MTRKSTLAFARMVVIGVGVSLLGCDGSSEPVETTPPELRSASHLGTQPGGAPPNYADVVSSAWKYWYGKAQEPSEAKQPEQIDEGEDLPPSLQITFEKASSPFPDRFLYGRIVGRIVSSEDIKKFGIRKGITYLWRLQPGGDYYTVPKDASSKGKRLKLGNAFSDEKHSGTHLVRATKSRLIETRTVVSFGFGVCTDDCPTGHCGLQ